MKINSMGRSRGRLHSDRPRGDINPPPRPIKLRAGGCVTGGMLAGGRLNPVSPPNRIGGTRLATPTRHRPSCASQPSGLRETTRRRLWNQFCMHTREPRSRESTGSHPHSRTYLQRLLPHLPITVLRFPLHAQVSERLLKVHRQGLLVRGSLFVCSQPMGGLPEGEIKKVRLGTGGWWWEGDSMACLVLRLDIVYLI